MLTFRQRNVGRGPVWPPHAHKDPEHGKKSHEVENKDRGWTLEVEVLSHVTTGYRWSPHEQAKLVLRVER